ncbi:MAG TPA: PQQ-binding-like beta-propeller repeat protein [Pyrinomonadaceae bacterium]|jgi:outer membrane protein assembly factor BamB|nr:PQQ-binding-like beta-propeller repeat protein [Pyrinomonadaceae bacterium]
MKERRASAGSGRRVFLSFGLLLWFVCGAAYVPSSVGGFQRLNRAGASVSTADAWPQWGGAHRDFKSDAKGLATRWPANGPRKLWERALGEGHSSIVSDGARLYTMYRRGASEYVVALDAASGRTVWEHEYAAPILPKMDMSYGTGPHSTPLLAGELVCSVGTTGKLLCLNRTTGKRAWDHDLWADFGGSRINVGYASSPIAFKETIIVQVGGAGRGLMAFNRRDGSVAWQAQNFRNSSSSPIIVAVDGEEQLIAFMHNEVVGLKPESGELLWRHAVSAEWDFHFNISTPVWGAGNLLFVSAAYGMGGRVLQLSRAGGQTSVRELWQSERTRVHKENAIRLGDVIYASTGHLGPAFFTAMDVRTGRVLWQERGFSHASFLYADGKFIILDEDGTLGLATPTPTGLNVHSRVELLSGTSWTVPTLVGTTLYIRDRRNIMALRLN